MVYNLLRFFYIISIIKEVNMKKEDIVIVELQKRQDIEDLGSAATIEGLELNSIPKYVELIEKLGGKFKIKPGEKLNVYVTSGAQMNKSFRLKGSNAYPDDIHIVSIKLEDFDHEMDFCLKRLQFGIRWMDDIIDNNRWHNRGK